MKWFKHEASANMDAKLQEVLLDYGLEGYGLYWYCLELIAGNVDGDNLTFELEHDCRIIARNTGSSPQKVQEMMTKFVSLGLFEESQGRVTCLKLAKVSDDYTSKLVRSISSQVIENKGVLQTPTNSEKDPLEENRLDKNRIDKNIVISANAQTKRKTKAESLFDNIRKSEFNLINQASDEILKAWCKHRIKKGASDSDLAHRDVEKHLQILLDHNLTVDQSFTEQVSRGWAGLKSEWFDCVKTGVSANNGNYNPDSDWTKNIGDTF